ncbi:hypothetical protein MSG28_015721 [Choristoneura fumiferana]|uniref:Uncharacterized protein n=1 Tax=Choristoneura fumiferana TaxID=7141 RepID=A0ACC0KBJ3_CHOFU|nr:hypothetical protein MSG28_015721 [Choristoneura fumiferana]
MTLYCTPEIVPKRYRKQVQYAPKVRVFIKSGSASGRIQEGDTLVIGCQANANPNNLTYRWILNNEQIAGAIRNELRRAVSALVPHFPTPTPPALHGHSKRDQVVGPCARSARIATTIMLANPAVKQQCLHCCVSAWRVRQPVKLLALEPIYVPLLGTGILSEQEGLGHSSHAGPVRIGIGSFHQEILPNISRKLNEATVKCEVHNPVGKSADTKSLEISFGPTFREKPRDAEAESGSAATLTCLVDGYPTPDVSWILYKGDKEINVGSSSNLTVVVNSATAGQYWCRASADGYQDIAAPAMVYVKGPPRIMSNQTQYGVEGDSVRIECISFSVPKPDYVLWTFAGNEINSYYNQEYAFLEETLTDGKTKSTLIIRESEARHFGTYNCSVSNLYGSDNIEIKLVPDKSLPLILIITGGASAIIVILIIMLIIMLCHRKNRKSDVDKKPDITNVGKTNVDQFKDSDRSSNISDLKLELRQVEGSCELDPSNGSDTEFHSSLQLTTNLGLPLAGPVPLPDGGYVNDMMKPYQRYSGDFNQAITNLNFKKEVKTTAIPSAFNNKNPAVISTASPQGHGQSNGYVPYVDYSRDYAPPHSSDSLTGSFRTDPYPGQCGSLHRQASCGRLGGMVGPDVIPMANQGALTNGVDVRYAATYAYTPQVNTAKPAATPAPPPYYTIRNTNLPLPATSVMSPSSSSSSKPVSSPIASMSSVNSSAQPQVSQTRQQMEHMCSQHLFV